MPDETEDELIEDFGSPRLSDSEIEQLLGRARAAGDLELRRLIKEVRMWRWFAPQLLQRLDSGRRAHSTDDGDALLKMARLIAESDEADEDS